MNRTFSKNQTNKPPQFCSIQLDEDGYIVGIQPNRKAGERTKFSDDPDFIGLTSKPNCRFPISEHCSKSYADNADIHSTEVENFNSGEKDNKRKVKRSKLTEEG